MYSTKRMWTPYLETDAAFLEESSPRDAKCQLKEKTESLKEEKNLNVSTNMIPS